MFKDFDTLCPLWTQMFDAAVSDMDSYQLDRLKFSLNLDIGNPAKCVAGEAWQWKSAYFRKDPNDFYCETCTSMAHLSGEVNLFTTDKIDFIIFYFKLQESKDKNWRQAQLIIDFVDHFNQTHLTEEGELKI